jgi:hypothetical protein
MTIKLNALWRMLAFHSAADKKNTAAIPAHRNARKTTDQPMAEHPARDQQSEMPRKYGPRLWG